MVLAWRETGKLDRYMEKSTPISGVFIYTKIFFRR
uniref:Uncharacterized protein n=1 Tax=Siphoviridae sp. ct1TR2 TaxID=2825309 RepID=A0A8S5NSH1_9CAUD|nr:MAG TPA: hypothetical protein [Siphoviridae sp. ct1TR2]